MDALEADGRDQLRRFLSVSANKGLGGRIHRLRSARTMALRLRRDGSSRAGCPSSLADECSDGVHHRRRGVVLSTTPTSLAGEYSFGGEVLSLRSRTLRPSLSPTLVPSVESTWRADRRTSDVPAVFLDTCNFARYSSPRGDTLTEGPRPIRRDQRAKAKLASGIAIGRQEPGRWPSILPHPARLVISSLVRQEWESNIEKVVLDKHFSILPRWISTRPPFNDACQAVGATVDFRKAGYAGIGPGRGSPRSNGSPVARRRPERYEVDEESRVDAVGRVIGDLPPASMQKQGSQRLHYSGRIPLPSQHGKSLKDRLDIRKTRLGTSRSNKKTILQRDSELNPLLRG